MSVYSEIVVISWLLIVIVGIFTVIVVLLIVVPCTVIVDKHQK
jgi:hypothetical protein